MDYDWPHTRASIGRLKTAWAYILVKWAMKLDYHEVVDIVIDRELIKEPTTPTRVDGGEA